MGAVNPMFIYLVGATVGGAVGVVLGRQVLKYVLSDLERRAARLALRPWPFGSQRFARRWLEVVFLFLAPLTAAGLGASMAAAVWSGRAE
jgi:hypothetical protein